MYNDKWTWPFPASILPNFEPNHARSEQILLLFGLFLLPLLLKLLQLGMLLDPKAQRCTCIMSFGLRCPFHRVCFIFWMDIRACLRTVDRVIKWGIHTTPLCPLCSLHNEDLNHRCFNCPFSRLIW